METPCWCPSEGHQHGGRKMTEKSVIDFCTVAHNLRAQVSANKVKLLKVNKKKKINKKSCSK